MKMISLRYYCLTYILTNFCSLSCPELKFRPITYIVFNSFRNTSIVILGFLIHQPAKHTKSYERTVFVSL